MITTEEIRLPVTNGRSGKQAGNGRSALQGLLWDWWHEKWDAVDRYSQNFAPSAAWKIC